MSNDNPEKSGMCAAGKSEGLVSSPPDIDRIMHHVSPIVRRLRWRRRIIITARIATPILIIGLVFPTLLNFLHPDVAPFAFQQEINSHKSLLPSIRKPDSVALAQTTNSTGRPVKHYPPEQGDPVTRISLTRTDLLTKPMDSRGKDMPRGRDSAVLHVPFEQRAFAASKKGRIIYEPEIVNPVPDPLAERAYRLRKDVRMPGFNMSSVAPKHAAPPITDSNNLQLKD